PLKLEWMPTLMSDRQMVLPTDTVLYQAQEVAAVVATERYIAADGVAAIEVDYEPLPVVVDPIKALQPGATLVREDREQKDNHIWHWEVGDKAGTDKAFKDADVVVKQEIYIPRIHVSSIETCGMVASFDKVNGKLTVRSEERRVGKECRCRWWSYEEKKHNEDMQVDGAVGDRAD